MRTRVIRIDPEEIDISALSEAAKVIREGGLVAFPTETVYGLGADAFNSFAVSKIFQVKGRPPDNPLIVHVGDFEDLYKIAKEIPPIALKIGERMWPGPLTLILRKSDVVPPTVTAGLETVAVRFPAHPVALKLIHLSGTPIAAPSANLSGKPSPTAAEHVIADLMDKVDIIIDSGETIFGVESTIINVVSSPPTLLRPGPVEVEKIREIIGEISIPSFARGLEEAGHALAPGMRYRHYSPNVPLILVEQEEYSNLHPLVERVKKIAKELISSGQRTVIIATDETRKHYTGLNVISLGSRKNLYEVAHRLFATLRSLDNTNADVVIAEGFPEQGLGLAIMNRLRKASSSKISHR
ncbi:MAG: L-threonylcarbamoyladenylate synthase [Candidatus Korarchaeota archaeon]